MLDLKDENFLYKCSHIHILPNFGIEGAAFFLIFLVFSNNEDKQILYVIKNSEKVAYYEIRHIFIFKILHCLTIRSSPLM